MSCQVIEDTVGPASPVVEAAPTAVDAPQERADSEVASNSCCVVKCLKGLWYYLGNPDHMSCPRCKFISVNVAFCCLLVFPLVGLAGGAIGFSCVVSYIKEETRKRQGKSEFTFEFDEFAESTHFTSMVASLVVLVFGSIALWCFSCMRPWLCVCTAMKNCCTRTWCYHHVDWFKTFVDRFICGDEKAEGSDQELELPGRVAARMFAENEFMEGAESEATSHTQLLTPARRQEVEDPAPVVEVHQPQGMPSSASMPSDDIEMVPMKGQDPATTMETGNVESEPL